MRSSPSAARASGTSGAPGRCAWCTWRSSAGSAGSSPGPCSRPGSATAGGIAPVPLLVVHGDRDEYFPVDHAQRIYDAAGDPKELWIVPGFGHAESGAGPQLIRRIGEWVRASAGGGRVAAAAGGAGAGGASAPAAGRPAGSGPGTAEPGPVSVTNPAA